MGAGEALRGAGAQRVRERREWEGRSMCQGAGAQRERGEGGGLIPPPISRPCNTSRHQRQCTSDGKVFCT